jgi:hypothetical protein
MYIRVNGKIYKVRQDSNGYYYEQSKCTHNKQRVSQGSEMMKEYPHKRQRIVKETAKPIETPQTPQTPRKTL